MPEESKELLKDSEFAIRALREYIQALPDEVVAALPTPMFRRSGLRIKE